MIAAIRKQKIAIKLFRVFSKNKGELNDIKFV